MTQLKRLRESEWDKNLVKKKCKVTRQIITRSISKINDKIYCHHDNDLYAEDKLIIERVNEYCLAEIFMYIPACERPKFALVCKQWKRALDYYSWSNVRKIEITHWKFDEYPNYLTKHFPTIDRQFNFLKSLLYKCGRYLTELDVTAYDHCNIVPVINECCPNLVKLRIRIKYIDDAILDNAFTGLSKLKVLKIIFQCFPSPGTYVPLTLLNSLLNVADTLTELSLSNWSRCIADNAIIPDEFTSVVTELKALRETQIGGIICSNSLIKNILSIDPEMMARYDECKYNENKIDRKSNLESIEKLTIRKSRIADDFLYNIANIMGRLHTLQIYCRWATDAGMVAISKLNCLRRLDCYGVYEITDSSIKLLKNLLVLNLPFSTKITDKTAMIALENSPELYHFGVFFTNVTSDFIKKAEEISRDRKKKLKIVMSREYGMPNTPIEYEYLTVNYIKRRKKTKIRQFISFE